MWLLPLVAFFGVGFVAGKEEEEEDDAAVVGAAASDELQPPMLAVVCSVGGLIVDYRGA